MDILGLRFPQVVDFLCSITPVLCTLTQPHLVLVKQLDLVAKSWSGAHLDCKVLLLLQGLIRKLCSAWSTNKFPCCVGVPKLSSLAHVSAGHPE